MGKLVQQRHKRHNPHKHPKLNARLGADPGVMPELIRHRVGR